VMVGQIRYEWIKRIRATLLAYSIIDLEYTDGQTTKSVRPA
jgi:hypothetical protein